MAKLTLKDAVCTLRVDADVKVAEDHVALAEAAAQAAEKVENAALADYESKFSRGERFAAYFASPGQQGKASQAWFAGVSRPKYEREQAELVRDRWKNLLGEKRDVASRTRIYGQALINAHAISDVGAAAKLEPCPPTATPENVKAEAEAWGDVLDSTARNTFMRSPPVFGASRVMIGPSGFSFYTGDPLAKYRERVAAIPHSSEGAKANERPRGAEPSDADRQGM